MSLWRKRTRIGSARSSVELRIVPCAPVKGGNRTVTGSPLLQGSQLNCRRRWDG